MEVKIVLNKREIRKKKLDDDTLKRSKSLFETHGFLKIENLFEKELIQKMAADLSVEGGGVRIHSNRYIVPVPLSGSFNDPDFYAHPVLLTLMKALLGPEPILNSLGAVVSLPGAVDQHIHSDYEPLFKEDPILRGSLPTYAITVGVPLVDIDLINGPTKIWSGSHRSARVDKERVECYEKHFLYGAMGSCYFWDYRTLHAGGSNHSEGMRPLLYMAFTRRWFKDFLNPDQLVIEESELAKIPHEYHDLFPIPINRRNQSALEDYQSSINTLFSKYSLAQTESSALKISEN